MINKKLYPLADFFVYPEKGISGLSVQKNLRAQLTGEFRAPRKDEWYLSGAIPQAYRAPNDLTMSFYIVKIVKIEIQTSISVAMEF
jgi:hypothetical protein